MLSAINAVALRPGDILVVHCAAKLSPVERTTLEQDITKQLWGKPNTFMILTGHFQIAAATPSPHA